MKTCDMMLELCSIEFIIVEIKKLACDGSFVTGHTVNPDKALRNKERIREKLAEISAHYTIAEEHFVS